MADLSPFYAIELRYPIFATILTSFEQGYGTPTSTTALHFLWEKSRPSETLPRIRAQSKAPFSD